MESTQKVFKIGDKVYLVGDRSKQLREVVSFNSKAEGVYYTVTSRDVDMEKKELLLGVMTVTGNELLTEAEFLALEAEEKVEK
jgi:hypothetical protein